MTTKKLTAFLLVFSMIVSLSASVAFAQGEIGFWTTTVQKERIATQEEIIQEFKDETGISVKLIPVKQSNIGQKITSAKAAGTLPDIISHPITFTKSWVDAGILDAEAATEVINDLGEDTFNGLRLVKNGDQYMAIPSDGWGDLIIYRKDLYEENDLQPPNTWGRALEAAKKLHNAPTQYGFMVGTTPNRPYTMQVFEQVAMSNGVRLVDGEGNVTLDTPEMVEVLEFYKKLVNYTPKGNIYWKQTRLFYLTGKTATTFWSPFIMDEMAGAREDITVGVDDLPEKTGMVTSLSGPNGEAGYLSLNSFGITANANTEAAKKFVKFVMNEGYVDYFNMDPFGMMPMRTGTPSEPNKFVKEWRDASEIFEDYPTESLNAVLEGFESGDRWGLAKGYGSLVSKIYGQNTISRILVEDYLRGSLSAEETAEKMQKAVENLKEETD